MMLPMLPPQDDAVHFFQDHQKRNRPARRMFSLEVLWSSRTVTVGLARKMSHVLLDLLGVACFTRQIGDRRGPTCWSRNMKGGDRAASETVLTGASGGFLRKVAACAIRYSRTGSS